MPAAVLQVKPVGQVLPAPQSIWQYASNLYAVLAANMPFTGAGAMLSGKKHDAVPTVPVYVAVHLASSAGVIITEAGTICLLASVIQPDW